MRLKLCIRDVRDLWREAGRSPHMDCLIRVCVRVRLFWQISSHVLWNLVVWFAWPGLWCLAWPLAPLAPGLWCSGAPALGQQDPGMPKQSSCYLTKAEMFICRHPRQRSPCVLSLGCRLIRGSLLNQRLRLIPRTLEFTSPLDKSRSHCPTCFSCTIQCMLELHAKLTRPTCVIRSTICAAVQ